jgi:hypothetical protein
LNRPVTALSFHGGIPVLPGSQRQYMLLYSMWYDLLHRRALEEQVNARAAHYEKTRAHASIDDICNPFLSVGDADQCKANGTLHGNEREAPWLLEDIKPLLRLPLVEYCFPL